MENVNEMMREPLKTSTAYVAGMAMVTPSETIFKLNANENQFGPSTKALEAMKEVLANGYLYPGNYITACRKKIAQFHGYGMKMENIAVYNGSGSAINAMGETFLNPGDEVVISSPTYMQYAPLPARYGAKVVEVPSIDGLYTNLSGMLAAITPNTKLMFICNPNNPTGTIVDNKELDEFIEKLPEHVICVIDEAYFHWIGKEGYESAFRFINSGKKVIVLRTFSKVYGMAGIRCGFAAASEEIIKCLFTSTNLFYTNIVAAAGAVAALDDSEFYDKVYNNNKEQREYMSEEMTKMGVDVVPSETSFIYFDAHTDNAKCMEILESHGVYIRGFGEKYLRVSIGLPHQNQAFLDALKEAVETVRRTV